MDTYVLTRYASQLAPPAPAAPARKPHRVLLQTLTFFWPHPPSLTPAEKLSKTRELATPVVVACSLPFVMRTRDSRPFGPFSIFFSRHVLDSCSWRADALFRFLRLPPHEHARLCPGN